MLPMATNEAYQLQNSGQDGINLTTSSRTDSNINIGNGHTYSNVCYGVIGSHTIKNTSYNVQPEGPEMVNNVCYGIVGGQMQLEHFTY